LREEVHRLKGIGGGFGFPELTERCAEIETTLKQTNHVRATALLDDLAAYSERIIKKRACA
jgi:HPt (histidine-containing phosphotransfer) domain-containing protein